MALTFGQLLSGVPKPPTVQEILGLFGTDDPSQRGHARSCRNAAAPLDGLLSKEASLHQPYESLKRSLWSKADIGSDEIRHTIEQIILGLDKTPSSDADKMVVLAVIMTKIDDEQFLRKQLTAIQSRLPMW